MTKQAERLVVQKLEKMTLVYAVFSYRLLHWFCFPLFTFLSLSFSLLEHLSPCESDGDMLGYDLYSSALADILSEPTMQPPICVGLYAQWGSGKSFLLKKLEGT